MQGIDFWLQIWQLAVIPIILAIIALIGQFVAKIYEIRKVHEEKRVNLVLLENKGILTYFNDILAILNQISFVQQNFRMTQTLNTLTRTDELKKKNLFKICSDYKSLYWGERGLALFLLPTFVEALFVCKKALGRRNLTDSQFDNIREFIIGLDFLIPLISRLGMSLTFALQKTEKLQIITNTQFEAIQNIEQLSRERIGDSAARALEIFGIFQT